MKKIFYKPTKSMLEAFTDAREDEEYGMVMATIFMMFWTTLWDTITAPLIFLSYLIFKKRGK